MSLIGLSTRQRFKIIQGFLFINLLPLAAFLSSDGENLKVGAEERCERAQSNPSEEC